MQLGAVTPEQFNSVEARVLGELGLPYAALTENAGCAIAEQARRMLETLGGRPIVVLTGAGENGAVGAVAARRLASWGAEVTLLLAVSRTELGQSAGTAVALAEQFDVRVFEPGALLPPAELIIDALVGCGLKGTLEGEYAELAATAGKVKVPVLAVDVPSGLDADSGKANQPAIRADVTVTLGYPKTGLVKPFATQLVGTLIVADIGIPGRLWQQFGQAAPDFSTGPLLTVA